MFLQGNQSLPPLRLKIAALEIPQILRMPRRSRLTHTRIQLLITQPRKPQLRINTIGKPRDLRLVCCLLRAWPVAIDIVQRKALANTTQLNQVHAAAFDAVF
jgi:hypothetical protein